jgi:hypothetical protein
MSGAWERQPVPLACYTDGGVGTSVDGCLTCGVAIPESHYRTVLVMAEHLLTSAAFGWCVMVLDVGGCSRQPCVVIS